MHLKQLKLAGFKSFVDPTVVHFPSQLVAVVGPNGCGKSNIIDAVRWVMGESSAKNLRGESMVDVIFNGSSQRKSLGQASVELLFDNSLGRLTGPFASYGEISVKRIVTRDGDSSYYLNGMKCRRKDVTDIFLGTGAGARGYSIISQGTVSRLIEARPEELRVFLEEAAGVSKYKERRRETLQRMERTEENLSRVADIREELSKQLQRLERQAVAAERYMRLKEEEKSKRADILALKWKDLKQTQRVKQEQLHLKAQQYQQLQEVFTQLGSERTVLNEQVQEAGRQVEQTQALFYQLGTEIVRLEETIQQHDRDKKRLERDKQQQQEDWVEAQGQLIQNKEVLEHSFLQAKHLETQRNTALLQLKEHEHQLLLTQTKKSQWEERNEELMQKTNYIKRELQVAQLNSQHGEQRRQQALVRLEQLQSEQATFTLDELHDKREHLGANQEKIKTIHTEEERALQEVNALVNQERLQTQTTERHLHQMQDDFYRLNSELAALKAWQHAARKANKNQEHGIEAWSEKPKLMDLLQVEPTWQIACEVVLGENLQAYVLQSFEEFWSAQAACEAGGEAVVTLKSPSTQQKAYPKLSDSIKGQIPITAQNLDAIYTAKHLDEAKMWLPHLSDDESIITANGVWLGKGWVRCPAVQAQDELGLLASQQKITELAAKVFELQQHIDTLKATRDKEHNQLAQSIQQAQQCQTRVNASNESLRTQTAEIMGVEQAILHATQRIEHIALEVDELQTLLEETAVMQLEGATRLHDLESKDKEYTQQKEQVGLEKKDWSDSIVVQSKALDTSRQLAHQAELEHDREQTKIQQIKTRIASDEERLAKLATRLEYLALLCHNAEKPDAQSASQLNELIMKQKEVNLQLDLIREQSTQFKRELETLEKNATKTDGEVKTIQEIIAQIRLQEQELALRASAAYEALEELGFEPQTVFQHIPEGVTQTLREEELLTLTEQIKRLGAINLAAIEEFATEQQRKQYLDEQYEDLNQALAALGTAIQQMDKETLLRLESTFDEVNTFFKALFPRLFGGGRAQLELTCDNLLEAGIVVMAQPPGKRNSTIHLLSGGEKAMTAVALVFALFQLNPSPFCMLDEVDAPLDDVNVGRFCDLVKEMSQLVQFLFITHNKVTMELADHLIGVTMREPGVSRLVTVDVKQALTLE